MDTTAIVSEYYDRVDSQDIEWIIDLFEDQAVYQRADSLYNGRAEIANFFRNERLIRGKHSIKTMVADKAKIVVVAIGHFSGVGDQEDPREVDFADVWTFEPRGLVTRRETYLAIGHAYVQA